MQARREVALWQGLEEREEIMVHTVRDNIRNGVDCIVTAYDCLLFPISMETAAWCVDTQSSFSQLLRSVANCDGRLIGQHPRGSCFAVSNTWDGRLIVLLFSFWWHRHTRARQHHRCGVSRDGAHR
jgi:hypothetical protein